MLGVLVNTVAVIIGSTLGLLCKKGFSEKINQAVMLGIGLCTIYIGISGSLKGENTLVLIISMVLGAIVGTLLDIDSAIGRFAKWIEGKFQKKDNKASVAEGFVTACLLFCIGAMTLVGSLNAGLTNDNQMLFTKSLLDFVSSILLSASLGIGVMLSAAFVLVFQGGIVLLAHWIAPILTASAIAETSCVGSVLIFALGMNIIGITKIKVANYLPAIIFAPLLCWLFSLPWMQQLFS